jgi:D-glucosaminate-6-phosphate ammonia-lyase
MATTSSGIGESIMDRLGVKPIVQAGGPNTKHSGSTPRSETFDAMQFASRYFFQLDELLIAAGALLADIIGVPAVTITSGAAAGLVVQAAAAVAKDDPDKIARLPDTGGMANELIIQRGHHFGYERLYLVPGTKFVWIGDEDDCSPQQMEDAISEKTAGIVQLETYNLSPGLLPLGEIVEIAHRHSIPVLCDAASMLPPRSNLTKFVDEGADLVSFSGGKAVRSLQSTGLLVGSKEWVEYARLNNAPNTGIARGQKVSKEEIFGLVASVEAFLTTDEEAETAMYRRQLQLVVDQIAEIPGIEARIEHNPPDHYIPHAIVYFQPGWRGPDRLEIQRRLLGGEPRVYIQVIGKNGEFYIDPLNIQEGEIDIVARRVREVLVEASSGG